MNDRFLPVHAVTGLAALGYRRNGAPIWPVLGGSGDVPKAEFKEPEADTETTSDEDDDTAQDLLADAVEDGEPDEPDDSKNEDKPLGPAGEKALNAEKEKRRTEANRRRAAERERDDAQAELEKLRRAAQRQAAKTGSKAEAPKPAEDGEDVDPEEIRREAEKTAVTKANEKIVKAEVRASAAGKLNDPKDALKFLDLSKFEVDADGNVDSDEIDDSIADLLKNKPYLAVAQGDSKRFKGSGDGGAKPAKPARPRSLGEAVVRHYETK